MTSWVYAKHWLKLLEAASAFKSAYWKQERDIPYWNTRFGTEPGVDSRSTA